jgi:hypothetical protein
MKKLKIRLLSVWYGVRFESGYTYARRGSQYDKLMEWLHKDMLEQGYEQYTDVYCYWFTYFCWYRKPNPLKSTQ